jgi:hypothetical protein
MRSYTTLRDVTFSTYPSIRRKAELPLLLDNSEHLVEGPEACVLATSRVALGSPDELDAFVESLPTPGAGRLAEEVEHFVQSDSSSSAQRAAISPWTTSSRRPTLVLFSQRSNWHQTERQTRRGR